MRCPRAEMFAGLTAGALASDPLVGVAFLSVDLDLTWANGRWGELFFGRGGGFERSVPLRALFCPEAVEAFGTLFERVFETKSPLVSRCIRGGRRVQSTVHPLPVEIGEPQRVCMLSTAGEATLLHGGAGLEIREFPVVDLGELDRLTRRELEILALIGCGLGRETIAKRLHRSPKTIDNHTAAIVAKLEARNRPDLIRIARRAALCVEHASMPRSCG